MLTLLCTKDVVMLVSNEIRFKAGQCYDFFVHADGSLSRMTEKGLHLFRSEVWNLYFEYSLENCK